jgi:hypothetical protein
MSLKITSSRYRLAKEVFSWISVLLIITMGILYTNEDIRKFVKGIFFSDATDDAAVFIAYVAIVLGAIWLITLLLERK